MEDISVIYKKKHWRRHKSASKFHNKFWVFSYNSWKKYDDRRYVNEEYCRKLVCALEDILYAFSWNSTSLSKLESGKKLPFKYKCSVSCRLLKYGTQRTNQKLPTSWKEWKLLTNYFRMFQSIAIYNNKSEMNLRLLAYNQTSILNI